MSALQSESNDIALAETRTSHFGAWVPGSPLDSIATAVFILHISLPGVSSPSSLLSACSRRPLISQMSCSGDSDDEWSVTDSNALKVALSRRIWEVHSAGSFATFGTIENFVHPGIAVDSVGTVRLPLSEDDTQALVQTSRQAPFGNGTETLVDVSVRKTWEIDAAKVQFLNKGWQRCLDGIVGKVTRELGVAGGSQNVRPEFYKMLLYEKGAMFKAHKEYVISRLHEVLG